MTHGIDSVKRDETRLAASCDSMTGAHRNNPSGRSGSSIILYPKRLSAEFGYLVYTGDEILRLVIGIFLVFFPKL